MSKRLLALLALVAAIGFGAPALMADHGDKGKKHQHLYQGRPYYYYQDEVGRIVVRRPIIEIHGSVDIH